MKKIIILLVILATLSSCASTRLLGEYPSQAYSATTSKSAEEVWNNIIDWFFSTKTPISLIDKASGIITSSKISLRASTTDEFNSAPRYKSKYVVVPEGIDPYHMFISGRVMARVKSEGDKTKVSVFLSDLECIPQMGEIRYFEVKSIGTFEYQFVKYITNE